jgi:aspartyl-tRNA(Asn)/glutamyl-tRNA(Gln) amidotransferase subunit A
VTALHTLSAGELLALYRRGEASPVDTARAVIAPHRALRAATARAYAFDPEAALAAARASEARWRAGTPLALDGVP